jgi:hypothetical protein
VGYLLFSLSGHNNYPSPAYITDNVDGPTGSVIEATTGSAPEDGFTCYAAFVGPNYGGCRWGDYSIGVVSNGRVYMAAEMVPPGLSRHLDQLGYLHLECPTTASRALTAPGPPEVDGWAPGGPRVSVPVGNQDG